MSDDYPLFVSKEALEVHAKLLQESGPLGRLIQAYNKATTSRYDSNTGTIKPVSATCVNCGHYQHPMGSDIWCEACDCLYSE